MSSRWNRTVGKGELEVTPLVLRATEKSSLTVGSDQISDGIYPRNPLEPASPVPDVWFEESLTVSFNEGLYTSNMMSVGL